MEQGRALRRAKYGKASYQGQDNYRALTWLTRLHLGDDVWAPAAPVPPEARLVVQTVQVVVLGIESSSYLPYCGKKTFF